MKKFSKDFIWGVATASYQIEGAYDKDGRGESIWDRFSKTPGKVLKGHTGDVACDHYHRYKEDIALIKDLGVDSYRFSLAWPRIIPEGSGAVNQKGIDFYKRLIDELLDQGISPAVTVYHWDLPQVLEDKGGWLNRDTAKHLRDFAAVAFEEFNYGVDKWITLNEPWCSAYLGYGSGEQAPGKKDFAANINASHHLLLAHGLALEAYRELNLTEDIGITFNLSHHYPVSDKPEDLDATRIADGLLNRWYLDPVFKGAYPADMTELIKLVEPFVKEGDLDLISKPNDFLGINMYSRNIVKADENGQPQSQPAVHPVTAMGWEIYPESLYDLLVRVDKDYGPIPIYITENGAAFDDRVENGKVHDAKRTDYLERHFAQAARAIEAGIPLKGYYVWSLLDNFEWAFGYERRFGIIYVDFDTQERIMKDSAIWYKQFLQELKK